MHVSVVRWISRSPISGLLASGVAWVSSNTGKCSSQGHSRCCCHCRGQHVYTQHAGRPRTIRCAQAACPSGPGVPCTCRYPSQHNGYCLTSITWSVRKQLCIQLRAAAFLNRAGHTWTSVPSTTSRDGWCLPIGSPEQGKMPQVCTSAGSFCVGCSQICRPSVPNLALWPCRCPSMLQRALGRPPLTILQHLQVLHQRRHQTPSW